jgi:curved DNA-binding protein CbpA
MQGIDPYKVLEVKKNFTLDELKSSYKRIAIQVHPDKGGSEYMFNMVTDCFKQLMKEYKMRTSDKQFGDLKQAFERFNTRDNPESRKSQSVQSMQSTKSQDTWKGPDRFDLEKFNKLFTENKRKDVHDSGYADWYTKEIKSEVPEFKGASQEAFNRHFEKHVRTANDNRNIIKYREPEALPSGKIQCTELGVDSIDDFSGENMSLKRLNFSDLKLAHTTSRIIDPRSVNRKEYQSVDELKRDRGNVTYQMSEHEMREYMLRKKHEEEAERRRLAHLQARDEDAERHYNKMHNLLRHTMR